jgi:hypothetical protein
MKNHRVASAAAIAKRDLNQKEHLEKVLKEKDEREKRHEKNIANLAATDRKEAMRCSRIDQLARKQIAANVDYHLPEALKSHVVKKFFECYGIEVEKAKEQIEASDLLKEETERLKNSVRSRAGFLRKTDLESKESKNDNVADIPHLKFLVHLV